MFASQSGEDRRSDATPERRGEAVREGLRGETTRRQDEILAFVRGFLLAHGYPPTIREIGEAMGIRSPNGVMCHVRALARKGRIRQAAGEGASRGWLPVVPEGHCPCCGRAGEPATHTAADPQYREPVVKGGGSS